MRVCSMSVIMRTTEDNNNDKSIRHPRQNVNINDKNNTNCSDINRPLASHAGLTNKYCKPSSKVNNDNLKNTYNNSDNEALLTTSSRHIPTSSLTKSVRTNRYKYKDNNNEISTRKHLNVKQSNTNKNTRYNNTTKLINIHSFVSIISVPFKV